MTWRSGYLPAVLALGFVLTGPAISAQQTNTPKRVGHNSQTHVATTPKKEAAHPQSGDAINLPADAVTNQGGPPATGNAGIAPHTPFTIAKQVNSSSSQLAPAPDGTKLNTNGGASAGSAGFSEVVGVSQSKDGNVVEFRDGSDNPLQVVPKGQAAGGSRLNTQTTTLPGNAVEATPANPPKRKKPAAPPHQP